MLAPPVLRPRSVGAALAARAADPPPGVAAAARAIAGRQVRNRATLAGALVLLGLALTEELVVDNGVMQTRSFGECRIPTIVDAPALPAIVAALRAATGAPLTRVPVAPEGLLVA